MTDKIAMRVMAASMLAWGRLVACGSDGSTSEGGGGQDHAGGSNSGVQGQGASSGKNEKGGRTGKPSTAGADDGKDWEVGVAA